MPEHAELQPILRLFKQNRRSLRDMLHRKGCGLQPRNSQGEYASCLTPRPTSSNWAHMLGHGISLGRGWSFSSLNHIFPGSVCEHPLNLHGPCMDLLHTCPMCGLPPHMHPPCEALLHTYIISVVTCSTHALQCVDLLQTHTLLPLFVWNSTTHALNVSTTSNVLCVPFHRQCWHEIWTFWVA